MNTFYKACKSCFSNRKLFQPFASITWQEEKRNVDEMEVTTTTKRYKSLALSFFTLLRLLYVFLFWAPVLWMLLMDSKDRSLLSCMSPPLEHTFLFAIWVCLFVFELFFYFMASFFCFFFFVFFSMSFSFFILYIIWSMNVYIISSVMRAFWLVLTYDLLEDRCIDDVIIKTFSRIF